MFWNEYTDRKVSEYIARTPRDADTGVMTGGEAKLLGPEDSDKAVLCVHGFCGTPNNFNDLPDAIAARGWRVHAMLLPGHGTTPRDFEHASAETLVGSVREELANLRERHKTVALLGHSMGGAIATIVAAQDKPDALALVSPYYAVTHQWYYGFRPETWSTLLSPVVRWLYRPSSVQPVNLVASRPKILSYMWMPTAGARTAIHLAALARSQSNVAGIDMPTLLIHARHDAVTDPGASAEVFGRIPTPNKRILWLEESNHIVFWDYDREKVMRETLDFLESVTAQ